MAHLNMSHDRGVTEPPLIEQTIGSFFDEMVQRVPDNDALVSCHQNIRYTYRQMQAESNRLASAFLEIGLQRGDRVGIWSHNNAQWLLTQLATAKVGIILVKECNPLRPSHLDSAVAAGADPGVLLSDDGDSLKPLSYSERIIRGAIINHNDFIRFIHLLHRCDDRLQGICYEYFFVITGYKEGQINWVAIIR